MSNRRELSRLLKDAERAGFEIERRRSGHFSVTAPDGFRTTAPSTPSDWRGLRNLRAALRRHGLPRETR